jgi:hypothetical protein
VSIDRHLYGKIGKGSWTGNAGCRKPLFSAAQMPEMTSPTFVQNDGCLTVVHRYLPVGSIESHFRTFVHEVYWKESGVGMAKKKSWSACVCETRVRARSARLPFPFIPTFTPGRCHLPYFRNMRGNYRKLRDLPKIELVSIFYNMEIYIYMQA